MNIHIFSLCPQCGAEGNRARWGERPTRSRELKREQGLHRVVDHTRGDRIARETGGLVNMKFVHQVLPVLFHRLDADPQISGDLLVGKTLGDELEHLDLATRKLHSGSRAVSDRRLGTDLPHAVGNRRTEKFASSNHLLNRVQDEVGGRILQQVGVEIPEHRLVDEAVISKGAQKHDTHAGSGLADLAGRFQAVHPRHADIHQHHIGPLGNGHFHGLPAIVRLAHHMDRVLRIEHVSQGLADEGVVIHDAD